MTGGGIESVVLNYCRHMDPRRVVFDFLVHDHSPVLPVRDMTIHGGRIFTVPSYDRYPVQYLRECERIFRREHPDIVHAHMNAWNVLSLGMAHVAGVPIRVAHSHTTSNATGSARSMIKSLITKPWSRSHATHYAACTAQAASWLFGAHHLSQVFLMRNAVEPGRFAFDAHARKTVRRELGLTDGQLHIGHVGRFSYPKNHPFILDVFADLLRCRPDAHLTLVGEQNDVDVPALIRERNLERHVTVVGFRNDVSAYYSAFDALLFPSHYEGFGMVGVEAQANGLPVLMSSNISMDADLVPGLVKHLPLEADVTLWSQTLEKLAYDHVGNRDDAAYAATVAERGYGIQANAESLMQWYESLLVT
ncbi:glycosyltransferase [Bifidobacterium choloepi]